MDELTEDSIREKIHQATFNTDGITCITGKGGAIDHIIMLEKAAIEKIKSPYPMTPEEEENRRYQLELELKPGLYRITKAGYEFMQEGW